MCAVVIVCRGGAFERNSLFQVSANIGSHFKISHKNIHKNIMG